MIAINSEFFNRDTAVVLIVAHMYRARLVLADLVAVRATSWAGQEADNLSIGSYSAVFTSLGLKLGGSSHKAIGKPPTPESFPSESIWVKSWQNMANWRRSRGQSHCKID